MMNFALTAEQEAWKQSMWHFCETEVLPIRHRLETEVDVRSQLFEKMAVKGLFLQTVPSSYGGSYTDSLTYLLGLSTVAKADAGVAVAMSVSNWVAEALFLYGTEEQKRRYLPQMKQGEWRGACFALTEEHAGSDPKSLECAAAHDPQTGGYILNGHKRWITNGNLANVCLVFAKVSMDDGSHGITAFLVEKGTTGWTVPTIVDKMGLLTVNLTNMHFKDCRIPQEQVIGKPGDGLKLALSMLDRGRLGIAAQAIGIAEAAFDASVKHAKWREQFGRPIGQNQAIAFKLADMHVKLEASRLLLYKAAWLRDNNESFTQAASTAKLFATESCNEIVEQAVQIHGGYGYIKEYPIERYFRDARITTIYEGTSEIQRIVISRQLLGC
ncbi:MAG: acyl-CoA dehydrogenase family protein [Chlamydiales bacterium]|nr:acyl-CoA dehydrogenase family protein [Chlamydiales bacterium]